MPLTGPKAALKASPKAREQSSAVWWSSIHRSPSHFRVKDIPPCLAKAWSIWEGAGGAWDEPWSSDYLSSPCLPWEPNQKLSLNIDLLNVLTWSKKPIPVLTSMTWGAEVGWMSRAKEQLIFVSLVILSTEAFLIEIGIDVIIELWSPIDFWVDVPGGDKFQGGGISWRAPRGASYLRWNLMLQLSSLRTNSMRVSWPKCFSFFLLCFFPLYFCLSLHSHSHFHHFCFSQLTILPPPSIFHLLFSQTQKFDAE